MSWRENNDTVANLVAACHGSSGWWRVNCPFCDGVVGVTDRSRALACSARTGWWSCWRCRTHGRLRGDFEDLVPTAPTAPSTEPARECELPEGWTELWHGDGLNSLVFQPAREYLATRVPQSMWWVFEIGAVLRGWAGRRIVVPIEDRNCRRVGWVGRAWPPFDASLDSPRYLYPKEMPRGMHFYNEAALWDDTSRPVFLVEGVFDCWAMWPDAVAFLGKKGKHHLDLLRTSPRPLVALLDGDAWRENLALFLQLSVLGKKNTQWLRLPAGSDPATVPRAWIEKELRK